MPLVSSLLLSGYSHYGSNYMGVQWCAGIFFLVVFISMLVYHRTDWLPALALLGLLTNCIIAFGFPNAQYSDNPQLISFLSMDAIYVMMCLILFSLFFINLDENKISFIKKSIPFITIANALYVIIGVFSCAAVERNEWLISQNMSVPLLVSVPAKILGAIVGRGRLQNGVGYSGFLDYAGMNGVLISLGLPFILGVSKKRILAIVICLIAVMLSKSSVPYGVIAVIIGSYFIAKFRWKISAWYILCLAPIAVGALIEKGKLFDSAGRFAAYRLFFLAWKKDANWWIGSGPGSFQTLAPIVQIKNGFMINVNQSNQSYFWLWAHSDWLQLLLENGIIGLTLITALFIVVLKKLYDKADPTMFSLACGLGAAALVDFPIRYFSMSFLTMLVIASAYL